MRLKFLAAIAALTAAFALPAAAQYDDSANINAAYTEGKASGEFAETVEDYWTCAAFWFVWSLFSPGEFGEAMKANLDPDLAEVDALETALYWEDKAREKLGIGMDPVSKDVEAYVDGQVGQAWWFGEGVASGEDYTFPFILGACARPASA